MKKNIFNLRFRRNKLVKVAAVSLALLTAGVFSNTLSAAAQVPLDVSINSRVVAGPGSPTNNAETTAVKDGQTVQFSVIAHNAADAFEGDTANDFKVRLNVPKAPATSAAVSASVQADNGSSPSPYKGTDTTTLTSANGAKFNLKNIRQVHVSHNNVAKTNQPTFNWTDPQLVPDSQINVQEDANGATITIKPNADGKLGPCFQNAVRIFVSADVQQAPELTIQKKVRETGTTAWLDENTIQRGKELDYYVKVQSVGYAKANNVLVKDNLPPNVKLIPGSVRYYDSGDPTPKPASDNFTTGGLNIGNYVPGATAYISFKATTTDVPASVTWVQNVATTKSDEVPEVFDRVRTNFPGPTPPPSSPPVTPPPSTPPVTPTPTPTGTPTSTPTPGIQVTPTPSAPSETPPPPEQPQPPTPSKGVLPATGTSAMGILALLATAISGYLYYRARQAHRKATARTGKK